METLRGFALWGATLATGLGAGTFVLYAHTVMPALAGLDDRAFVTSFAALDRAIVTPWFLGSTFLGAPVLTALAAWWQRGRPALGWVLVALALTLVVVTVTAAVHLPANDALKAAAGAGSPADPQAVRLRFDEARWVAWNAVRAACSTSAFGCLAWALVVHGRAG